MNAVLYAVLNIYNVHMSVVYINTMCTPPTHTTTYTKYIYIRNQVDLIQLATYFGKT